MGKIPLSPCLLVVHSKVFNVHESSFEFGYFDRFFFVLFSFGRNKHKRQFQWICFDTLLLNS